MPQPPQTTGFLAFHDPIRPTAPSAIAACHAGGVRVIMVTGDHALTAGAIARQAGIIGPIAPVPVSPTKASSYAGRAGVEEEEGGGGEGGALIVSCPDAPGWAADPE